MAADRDAIGIAAERADIVAHPTQGEQLILQAEIAALRIVVAEEQPAEIAEAVVERDDDEAVLARLPRSVEPGAAARPAEEGAAVNPDQHRRPASEVGAPDIEVEAILGGDRAGRVVVVF